MSFQTCKTRSKPAWWCKRWSRSGWWRPDDVEHKACVQRHHAGSGSALAPPRACVMYWTHVHKRNSRDETGIQSLFLFSLCKNYSRGFVKLQLNPWCYMDYFTNLLATFLDMGTFQLCCCLWRNFFFKQKYLNLCSNDERRSYGFGTTSGWVINDIIFIFGWTNPLR